MESVGNNDPHVRIGVDSVVRNSDGTYGSLCDGQVTVFAVFHNECVLATLNREDCDDVQYIYEARVIMTSTMGSNIERFVKPDKTKEPKVQRHLTCLQGGLTG